MGIIRAGNYGEFSGKVVNLIAYICQGNRVVSHEPITKYLN